MEQFTITIQGKSFFCDCGCNVFHKPDPQNPLKYKCNACQTEFQGEKAPQEEDKL